MQLVNTRERKHIGTKVVKGHLPFFFLLLKVLFGLGGSRQKPYPESGQEAGLGRVQVGY
jgi:hypothetical protein